MAKEIGEQLRMLENKQSTKRCSVLSLWHGGQKELVMRYSINHCLLFLFMLVFRRVFVQTVSWCKGGSMTNL